MPGAYAGTRAADDVVDGGSAVELRFGGFKKSGYGREKGYGALDAVTATKTVVVAR
ncbi:aldehyde dehydrogenase family protein [Mycolicibacterium boenickei]|uniref:aldehyde dehydrogenase family protein n=1 Tax=Mycolicibacterium boenickei TaxID=146017 RepID=UPI001F48008A|nr:aldehyde dehydrogenase family protein [Mycolicibacterium boenickei]